MIQTVLMSAEINHVSFPGLGITDLPVSRIAFYISSWPVYWYGILIAGALVICMLLAMRQAPRFGLTSDDVMDTFIAIIPLMIVFARLYYVVFEWNRFAHDWRSVFDTRQGGLAFYGGVIGGVLAIFLITHFKRIRVSRLLDFLVVYVPLGQAIGRWGNFFNQEAFGTNTRLPWGMISEETVAYLSSNDVQSRIPGLNPNQPVHPTFFYEFLANLILFFILFRVRKHNRTPFRVLLYYLLGYGLVRFFVEGIRTDPLFIPSTSIRVSQLLSAMMAVVSLIALAVLRRHRKKRELAVALAIGNDGEDEYEGSFGADDGDVQPVDTDVVASDAVEPDADSAKTAEEAVAASDAVTTEADKKVERNPDFVPLDDDPI